MIGYHYDTNCILATPLKNRKGSTIAEVWQSLYNSFKKSGVLSSTYILDNQILKDLTDGFD